MIGGGSGDISAVLASLVETLNKLTAAIGGMGTSVGGVAGGGAAPDKSPIQGPLPTDVGGAMGPGMTPIQAPPMTDVGGAAGAGHAGPMGPECEGGKPGQIGGGGPMDAAMGAGAMGGGAMAGPMGAMAMGGAPAGGMAGATGHNDGAGAGATGH